MAAATAGRREVMGVAAGDERARLPEQGDLLSARARDPAATSARRRRLLRLATVLGAALLLWALSGGCFALDVTEYGVVTRFGRVVRIVAAPGLHLKAPFDAVIRVDRRLLMSRPPRAEFLSRNKKNIVIDSLLTWRVANPRRFVEALGSREAAEPRLADLVLGELGSVLGRYDSAAFINTDRAGNRYAAMVSEIRSRAAPFTRHAYGIDLVDVGIRHLSLPEQNQEHVFDRMQAERGKIAKEFRSSGELEAREITAEADREKAAIDATAYAQAELQRAEGDATAARIYADAFSRDPGFYKFLRVLLAYQRFLDDKTTLFLPASAEALGVLGYELQPPPAPIRAPAISKPVAEHIP